MHICCAGLEMCLKSRILNVKYRRLYTQMELFILYTYYLLCKSTPLMIRVVTNVFCIFTIVFQRFLSWIGGGNN